MSQKKHPPAESHEKTPMPTDKLKEWNALWKLVRNILLFLVGAGGIIYETVLAHPINQPLLVIFAAMMGLPAFLRQDGI